jgi:hypothetical protein
MIDFQGSGTRVSKEFEPPKSSSSSVAPRPLVTAAHDARAQALEFLTAVRAGDDRAVDLAVRLADLVLDMSGARLALEVLEGGSLSITRAIRLAERVLETTASRAVDG